ncbi:MAG TPA: cation diffusion facilitator family transporter, partial [Gammaproteobacteria bacterium]|nr:cation diffusion facilitator family transporter [Gammaproteobacteria bacterium]
MQDGLGNYNKHRFLIGMLLNSAFICIEVFYGLQANSVALLADALHNASDVLGLCLAWFSYVIAQRQATRRFTYGFKNATIFAAFINSLILIFAIANLLWESFA